MVPVVFGALGGLVGETPQCLRTVQGGDLAIVQQEAIQDSIKILRTVRRCTSAAFACSIAKRLE